MLIHKFHTKRSRKIERETEGGIFFGKNYLKYFIFDKKKGGNDRKRYARISKIKEERMDNERTRLDTELHPPR